MSKKIDKIKELTNNSCDFVSQYMEKHQAILSDDNIQFLNSFFWRLKYLCFYDFLINDFEEAVEKLCMHLEHQGLESEVVFNGTLSYVYYNDEDIINKNVEKLEVENFRNQLIGFYKNII